LWLTVVNPGQPKSQSLGISEEIFARVVGATGFEPATPGALALGIPNETA